MSSKFSPKVIINDFFKFNQSRNKIDTTVAELPPVTKSSEAITTYAVGVNDNEE